MGIRREIVDCGAMGSRDVSRPPDNDNNNEEFENNIDESRTESVRYESNGDLSTTDKIFLNDTENSSSNEECQGVFERTYVNHDDVTDDSYILTGNKHVDYIQSVTGLYIVETGNVWKTFEKEYIGLFHLFMTQTYIFECVRAWTKSNPMAKIFATTKQNKNILIVSPNTVVPRRENVENPIYETHTVTNLSSPLATDDPT